MIRTSGTGKIITVKNEDEHNGIVSICPIRGIINIGYTYGEGVVYVAKNGDTKAIYRADSPRFISDYTFLISTDPILFVMIGNWLGSSSVKKAICFNVDFTTNWEIDIPGITKSSFGISSYGAILSDDGIYLAGTIKFSGDYYGRGWYAKLDTDGTLTQNYTDEGDGENISFGNVNYDASGDLYFLSNGHSVYKNTTKIIDADILPVSVGGFFVSSNSNLYYGTNSSDGASDTLYKYGGSSHRITSYQNESVRGILTNDDESYIYVYYLANTGGTYYAANQYVMKLDSSYNNVWASPVSVSKWNHTLPKKLMFDTEGAGDGDIGTVDGLDFCDWVSSAGSLINGYTSSNWGSMAKVKGKTILP